MASSPYFFPLRLSNPHSKAVLYIFHFSGGGVSSFRSLVKLLNSDINVIGVQLPGRENRFQESCIEDLNTVIRDLIKAFKSSLVPNAIFLGHSMGARLAFECVQAIRLRGISFPQHLIISGRRAPHRPTVDILRSDLTNEEMVTVLKKYGGLNDALLADEDVLSFLLPLMRSDLKLLEQFQAKVTLPLALPITVIGGFQDQLVLEEDLQAWKRYTAAAFKCRMFEGGHFFLLKESLDQVGQLINAIVTQEF